MNRIKELRKENNLTLRELSEKTGISFGALGNQENGRRKPKKSTLEKIANEFDVSVEYLQGKSIYRNTDDLLNKIASIPNNEKNEFIEHLNSYDLKLILDDSQPDANAIELLAISLKNTQKRIHELNQQRENFIKNDMYARTVNQLIQRHDNIDEDEVINITYKNELTLVYYLNLVQDNLATLKRDKVTDAITALKDVLNDDATTVSAELSAYLKKVRDYD